MIDGVGTNDRNNINHNDMHRIEENYEMKIVD